MSVDYAEPAAAMARVGYGSMVTDTLLEPPETDRPRMFGQAGLVPVLLPWSWAEHNPAAARHYWTTTTTRPDGRPHTRPLRGVRPESRSEVVILEGRATAVDDPETVRGVVTEYNDKYRRDLDPTVAASWYVMRPDVAFGWLSDETGLDQGAAFHGTTTPWRFAAR
jgi:hypothetical protein